MALLAWVLLLLPLIAALRLLTSRTNIKKQHHKLPPGPPQLPVIGNLHQVGPLPHISLHKISQKYGPLMCLNLSGTPAIIASSAHTAREFLKIHDQQCCSRPKLTSTDKLSYGFSDIAVSPYGDSWRELRKICIVNFFSSKKVESFRSIREDEVTRMIGSVTGHCGAIVNLGEELILLTNNITCRTALGRRYDVGGVKVHEVLVETQKVAAGFFVADYMPALWWLDWLTGMRGRLERAFRELDGFYEVVIGEHKDPRRRGERDEDVLDALLNMQKSSAAQLTDDQIKGVITDLFIAGSDTSASTVEWAMAELMRNPLAMKKAQNEIRGFIGSKGKVEESDLPQFGYLRSVIKETLRLHPPSPLLLPREILEDCKIDDYDLPAKSRLFINAWAIGRDPDVWKRPNEFDPDRFSDSSIDFMGHDFQLIPFGAGRRICPGRHIGILVVSLALANLLYRFDWELPSGMSKDDIDMGEVPGLAVHRRTSLHLLARSSTK